MTHQHLTHRDEQALGAARLRRALVWVALPLAVYALAALILTWPLVRHLTTHAAGAGYGDTYEAIRGTWWTREALLDGQNPFRQTLLAYPQGFTSWLQFTHPLQYVFPALLALVVSPLTAVNLILLAVLALNGTAAYWLGMHLSGRNPAAALVGGMVFMAFPAVQGHVAVSHLGMVELFPLPLLALCLWRVAREGAGWRTALWGGVWFALTALSYVSQITFILFPLVLFFGLHTLLRRRTLLFPHGVPLRDQPWLKVAALLGVGMALVMPFFLPVLALSGQQEVSDIAETGRVAFSTDPLAFASPSPFGPLKALAPGYTRDVLGTNSTEGSAYLGVVALGLALIALIARREQAGVWAWVALGAMLLSLGPLLKWHNRLVVFRVEDFKSYVMLPWAAFIHLPLFDATRTPGRFNLATALALSALASLGAGVLLGRVRRRGMQIALAALLGALILLEYQLFWPFPTIDGQEPEYFRALARQDEVRAVLNIPVENNLVAKIGLYQQTFHHKPLIAGHAIRRTVQDAALLAILERATTSDAADGVPALRREDVPYLLSQAGADRVVVHKRFYENVPEITNRLRAILGAPEYEDDKIAVFAVPRVPQPPPGFTLASAASQNGWSSPVSLGSFSGPFLSGAGDWYFYADQAQYGDLVFHAAPYGIPRLIAARLDGHLIAGFWAGPDEIRLPLILGSGYHTLRLEAVGGCTEYPFELTCAGAPALAGACAPLDPPACISAAFEPPRWQLADRPPTLLDVQLDHGLRLRAYDVRVEPGGQAVQVRLFWSADGSLPESYALFVHIANPGTGEPLAQVSEYPLFPTTAWGRANWQAVVRVALPDDLPAGRYAVNVGWFDPQTQTRLSVRGDRPWAAAGIVSLGTVETD